MRQQSEITVFGDAQCTRPQHNNIVGPDGHPDGSCTRLSDYASDYSSFQVAHLEPGCNVAIYGSDINSFICSSKVFEIAEHGSCYNASWVYYSIDGCIALDETPSARSSSSSQGSPTGAIVGGVVGGVVVLAALIGAFVYARRSRKLQREHREHNAQLRQDLYELASRRQVVELVDRRSPVEMEADTGFTPVKGKLPIAQTGEEGGDTVVPEKGQERRG